MSFELRRVISELMDRTTCGSLEWEGPWDGYGWKTQVWRCEFRLMPSMHALKINLSDLEGALHTVYISRSEEVWKLAELLHVMYPAAAPCECPTGLTPTVVNSRQATVLREALDRLITV